MIFDRIDKGLKDIPLDRNLEIELNKKMSQSMGNARKSIKTGKCFYCGKTVNSYCNSHNVPKSCLENIGNNGEVTGLNSILGLPSMGVSMGKMNPGINEAGTFHLICRECDSTIFQDYENPNNYSNGKSPTQKMLSQIALKNYLKVIYKRKMEIELAQQVLEQLGADLKDSILAKEFKTRLEVSQIDVNSYTQNYANAKKSIEKGKGQNYYLFYYKLLNYVTPIAIQVPITVAIDLEGKVVNDVFNMNTKYHPSDMHLCVFPQKETTAIIIFFEEGEKKYSKFRKQFNKLDEDSKLGVINYLIFLYSEDFFLSRNIKEVVDVSQFNEVVNQTPIIWNTEPISNTAVLSENFNLSKWNRIPNLLSEKYKLT